MVEARLTRRHAGQTAADDAGRIEGSWLQSVTEHAAIVRGFSNVGFNDWQSVLAQF